MGESEDGDGKGAKVYGVTGMIDGPGSVSTLMLVVVRSTEEGGGELLLPEENKLVELDADVTEEEYDCSELVDAGWDKGVGGDDNGDALECVGWKEDGGTAEAGTAAARRTRMAEVHMDEQFWEDGERMRQQMR